MRLFRFILGKVLGSMVALLSAVLIIGLLKSQALPTNLVATGGVAFVLLTVLVFLLTWSGCGKAKMTVGIILAVLLIGVLLVGSFYVWQGLRTLYNITNVGPETVHIGVYMRNDDPRDLETEVAAGYQYGILETIDREATDGAVKLMEEKLNAKLSCREYETAETLVNALLEEQVDAIILNQAWLETVQEIPGYEEKVLMLREVVLHKVQQEDPVVTQPTKPKNDAFVVYISGIDTTGKVSVRSRSDVNILAVVNPKSRQVLLVSTPRDYFVPLSISKGKPDKLTHAGNYGVNVSKDTLGLLYGIDIDYYFKVNFSGFPKVVDALGGITVQSDYKFSTEMYGTYYNFVKGENKLNGQQALVFCRVRKAFADGDHQRGKNQMAVIKGVIDKALSPKLLTNYTQILKAIEGSVEMSIPTEVIGDLVSQQISDGGAWNVVSYSVTGTGGYAVPYSMSEEAYVMYPKQETVDHAKELIQDVLAGKTVTP